MQPFQKHLAIGALALGLIMGAGSSYAADLTWTNGDGYWQSTTAWTTNGAGGTGGFPGANDTAFFTNAATYSVRLSNDVAILSNLFSNASNTTATVTLDLGTYQLEPTDGSFVVGDTPTSTTTVYLASSTAPGKGLYVPNWIVVGNNGIGTLVVTNGNVLAQETFLGFGDGSRGTLVLSGPNTLWTNSDNVIVGYSTNSFGSSLVISNSASLVTYGGLIVGDSTSNNTVLLDSGGQLVTILKFSHIGQYHGDPSVPSYNNAVIVQGGAVWDLQDHSINIGNFNRSGGVATGNVLTVGVGGFVTNVSTLRITASNTLNMAGGLYGGKNGSAGQTVGALTCAGTVQGYGTVIADATIEDGGSLRPLNSLGALVFSNGLILANHTTTTTVQLGTNYHTTVVCTNLTLDGALNIIDSGGFTTNTYTLFTCGGTLTYNDMTIGTAPAGYSYVINTNTPGQVRLVVTYLPPVAAFSGSPTNGEVPLAVTFTDSSTGTITNRFWDLGDGTTTNTTTTSLDHTYSAAGTYTVSLTVSGPGGSGANTQSNYIVVTNPPPPVAAFSGSPTAGTPPLAVTFTDTSTGSITNRYWNFGDGATTNTTTVSLNHTYAAGTYTVGLAVSGLGGSDTNTRSGYIVALNPPHLVVTPASLDFGSVTMGQTNSLSFLVINTGDLTLNGTATTTAPFAVTSGASYNVAGGQTQTVTIAFAPSSVTTFEEVVIFTSNGGDSTNTVTGSDPSPGSIAVTPATYDFGTLVTGTTAQVSFTVTNSGSTAVSNGTASVTGSPFSILAGATFDLPGFGATNVTVRFAPVSVGAFTDAVLVATADGGSATNAVTGMGRSAPATLIWTNGNDFWQSVTAWSTNTGGTGGFPGPGDTASFTNGRVGLIPAANVVTLNADVEVNQLWFNNAQSTRASVTLDLGTNSLNVYMAGSGQPTALTVADVTRCTATVYVASSTLPGKGLFITNATYDTRITIGRSGVGTLIVTNGNVTVNDTILANGSSACGTVVLSGTSTVWTSYGPFRIGNKSASSGTSSLVISNGASMTVTGQFTVGTQDQSTFLMDTGARLFTTGISNAIGNNGTLGNHYSTATIQGGAIWDNGNNDFSLGRGGPSTNNTGYLVSTGNVLSVGIGSAVVNISTALVSAANTLDLRGGLFQASVVITNYGTIRGFGSIVGDTIVASGGVLSVSNSLGSLTFSNSLTLASNATTKVQLGTSFNTTVVASNLTLDGTLNVTNSGGFTNGTYALFTYGGTLTTNGTPAILTMGTTPNPSMTYWVDIATSGQVNLVVWAPPIANFTASPLNGPWPLAVTFTDTSGGTITNRFWDFGDGTTTNITDTSLSHTYSAAGTSTVSLTAFGPVGTNILTRSNYVVVINPAHLVVDPSSRDFGSVTIGQSNSLSFSVINTGDVTLSGTATSTAPVVVTSGHSYNVAGGQTQTVTVAFAPDSAATFNDSVIFTSNGGDSTNAVSGIGLTPGSISVTPTTHDFGTLVTGTTAQVGFVVTNSGGTAVSNGTASVTGGPFSIVSGASFSVPGFGTANVTVQFAPLTAGAFADNVIFATANGGDVTNTIAGSAAIVPVASFTGSPINGWWPLVVTFTDNSTGTITNRFLDFGDGTTTNTTDTSVSHTYTTAATNTVSLTVSGPVGADTQTLTDYIAVVNPAHLVVNPGSLNFGSVTIGQTNNLRFSVINTGDVSLSGTATSTAPFVVTSGGTYNVAGGQTQTVNVAFAPESTATFNDSVIFTSNGGDSTNAVSGIGLTPGSISVSPTTHDFGLLVTGTTAQIGFVVTNSGGTAVSNGTATVTGGPFAIVSGASFSVPGFGTADVTVQFAPVSAGAFSNSVLFATANGGDATNTVTGSAAIVPVASFTANPTNGTAPLAVTFTDGSSGTISNRSWNFGDGNTTNTTATGMDHTYSTGGTYTVSLTVNGPVGTNTQTRSDYMVVLNPAHLVVNPGSLNFGSVTIGQTNSLSFSAVNTGDLPLSGTATGAAPFEVTSGASYNVAGGQTTTVTVAFAPESVATFHGWVVFTSDGGNSVNAVNGAGLSPGNILVTPSSHDFGTLVTGTTAQVSFVVTNTGGTTVSNGTATVTGGPFTIAWGDNFSVPGFGSTNLTVRFAPVSAGAFTNDVVLATANGGDVTNVVSGTAAIVPLASVTANPTNGTAPLVVTFTDSSSGTITNRFWNFGDGITTNTTATSLSHTYATAATNTVSLTVSGPVGADTLTLPDYIAVVNPAHLVVNPGSLNFGSVTIGQTNNLSFSVINTGDVTLSGTVTGAAPYAVTSGDPYNLAGGQTQTVVVAFAPESAATFNGSVIFTSNGGDLTNAVSGVGLTPGSISVTPAAHDFGTLVTGVTAQVSFVVTNSGATAVSNGTTTVSGPFSILSGASFSVPGFGTADVTVQFAPVNAGAFSNSVLFATANGGDATNTVSGTAAIVPVASFAGSPTNGPWPLVVSFTDNSSGTISNRSWDFGDGNTTNTTVTSLDHTYTTVSTNTVSLTVSGPVGTNTQTRTGYIVVVNPAHLAVNPGSLTYGSVTIAQTNSLNFSVINTGDVPLSGTATSSAPFEVTSGGTYNIAGGQTGLVTVAFTPDAATAFNGSVIFASNGGDLTNVVSGIGLTPGSISVTPAAHDFGTLVTGTTAQVSFVVTNSGGTTISNGTAIVSGPFSILSGSSFSVPGFGTANVTVQFAPVNAGAFSNSVLFATANGGDATNTVSGTAAIVPVASFTGSPTNGPWPLAVSFTDNSSGTISNRFWDFGDGNATNTAVTSLSHVYSGIGTNTVSVTVSGPVGTNTQTRTDYIVVINPAHLVVNPGSLTYGSVTIGQTNSLNFSVINTGDVPLSGTATSAAPFAVTSGTTYNVAGGQTSTVTVAFAPDSTATFNGLVLFTSDGGNSINTVGGSGLTPGSIGVTPASWDFGMLVTGTTAQASFSVTNSGGTAVSNCTATVLGGPFTIVSDATFGVSGYGSATVTVQFAPVSAGVFTDSVVLATANGGEATNTVTGAAAIVPVASFDGTPTKGTVPLAVTFTDSSSGTITNRYWNFGDGNTTNTVATDIAHTYNGPGTNTVSITVSGPVGASTLTRTNYIVAGVPPVVDFSASPTNGLTPFTVNFTDESANEITNRLWDFGDGDTSSATNPSHTYTNAGTYSVGLSVDGPYGTDTKTLTNLITVYAASVTWTNANADGNWSEATSWDPVTIPDFGSSVIFAGGGTTATVDSVGRTVGTVTFNRSANFFVGATGSADLTISNGIAVATNLTYTIAAPVVLSAANTWAVTNGGTLEISGSVSGGHSITKTGDGTVILTGANTYGGGTAVSGGTLLVNNTGGSGTGTGLVSVAAGATVAGHGVIEGPVVVANGGTFSAGSSVGTSTVSNNLTFGSTSVLQYELGTNSDLTVVSGDLTLDGILNVTDAGGFTNGSYTLFTYGGALATNGSPGILAMGTVPDTNMVYTVDISSNGCVKLVVVIPPPVADFSGNAIMGMAPFTVTFTNTSSGWVTNAFWDFGDGATSNTMAASVAHTYDAGGNISVQLIVSGPGGVSTNTRVGYLAVAPPCSYPLSGTNASFGVTGGSDIVTVTPYTNVCAWTASSNDAWIQIDGGGVSATGSAVVAYTVLPNVASSSSRVGTMTIAGQAFTVTQAGDTTSPTAVLTSPTAGIVSNTIGVSATATDDVAVVQVEFYRDGGVLLGTGTTSPSTVNFNTATVSDGSHCFYAEARDAAGNVSSSATNCVTVDNDAPSVPTGVTATAVATNQIRLSWQASNDDGSGVAGYRVFRDGTQIATTAGTDHTDSGLATGTEHCYTVAAYDNVGRVSAQSAEACAQSFVTTGSLLGTYNGLAIQTNGPSHASSGSFRLAITKTGSYAAKLAMGGGKAAFKGRFDACGNATNTVARKGLSPLQVALHLDLTYGTDQVTGTISDGVFTSELLADRAVYSRANPCPLAGIYTLVLVPPEGNDPDFPQGYGHGTLGVAATGAGKLSGVLGDGTKIKGNLPVSKHGTWPLYNVLYKNHGACIGWVSFGTNATLEATVDWFRPSVPGSRYYPRGFTTNVTLLGEKYVAPSAGESEAAGYRQITLDGGNLASSIVETVTVDTVGHVIVLPPNNESLTLTLQLKTGQFTGSFTHPSLNETIDFKGAVLQNSNAGAGHFLGTNESGSVILEPAP